MRAAAAPAILAWALGACAEPADIVVPEPEVRPSTGISLDAISFFFPAGLEFEGEAKTCRALASECPLADDSTQLVWRAGGIRFDYVLDPFGEALADEDWGEPVTINGRPAFRARLDDGSRRYLITNHYGGPDSAAVAIWRQREEPMFWGTCRSDEECEAVLQTLASVSMRSASQQCALMFPQDPPPFEPPPGYCSDCSEIPPPPAPMQREEAPPFPPAPPPPVSRPAGARSLCEKYL